MGVLRGWRRRAGRSPQQDFLEQVTAALDGAPGVRRLEPRPGEFALVVHRADGVVRLDLAAVFAESRHDDDAARAERVRRLVAGLGETGPGEAADDAGWDEVRPRLRPVLRGVSRLSLAADPDRAPAGRPAGLPLLAEMLVVDAEHTMRYVQRAELPGWGVDLDTALQAAHSGLAAVPVTVGERRAPDGRRLIEVTGGDDYASSRLLAPGWLQELEQRVATRLVAAVPSREELWAVPADDPAGLAWLVNTAREAFLDSPRGVSPVPYAAHDADGVVPWLPPPGDPLAVAVRSAASLLALTEYGAQQEELAELHRAGDSGLTVTPAEAVERPGGELLTMTRWVRGVPALLPETALLGLVADPADPDTLLVVRRIEAEEALDRCTEPAPGVLPARRRTTGFPDAVELAGLRRRALQL